MHRCGGGVGHEGAKKIGTNKLKPAKKATNYRSSMEAIKNDIFYCRKPKHAADFERSLKMVADYIHQDGDTESMLVARGIKTFTTTTINAPPMPPRIEDPDNTGVMIEDHEAMIMWDGELCCFPTQRNDLRNGLVQGYALLCNQCTSLMRSKLKQHPDFPTFDGAKDRIALVTQMRNIV